LIDVQQIHDFVPGTETVFSFELDDQEKAKRVIVAAHPGIKIQQTDSSLAVMMAKEQVPEMVTLLVGNQISIYGIKEMTKTLEDRFLEITGEKKGNNHG
jgi:ABC-2 type transport system ATP-binding protein